MQSYRAPLSDMQFLLYQTLKVDQFWQSTPSLAPLIDRETSDALLNEAAKVTGECISPINRSGDEEGAQWIEGNVKTPTGFPSAYKVYCDGGWPSISGDPAYGGMGLPKSFSVLMDEMLYGANSSFALYPCLSAGATLAINAHASEEIKSLFLPKMYSGEWAGTMCLTEPHAGSDLGLIRTKAIPNQDGTFDITGTKIFITGGDQDLTENIVHLVLAKLPDAPSGSRGISLFLVPKVSVNEEGQLLEANGVSCGSIEHKMGIKGSATCVMNFDNAKGYLIGEVNRGLQCMFTMMNYERLSIGIQGIGCAEMSYQNAVSYSRERLQGKDATAKQAAPIIVHPDVRRMLLTMKSTIEAGRAMSVYLGMQLDKSKFSEDANERAHASALVGLLTPVAKAFFTDLGLENTIHGQQVFGGHGYVREWGQEQLVRDVRIAQIYEGTNGIQALDLLQRKVFANRGEWLALYFVEIEAELNELDAESSNQYGDLLGYGNKLKQLLADTTKLTNTIIDLGEESPLNIAASATEYLHLLGYITYGFLWLKMMKAAVENKHQDAEFCNAKLATGQFFFNRVLTRTDTLLANLAQQDVDDYMCLNAASF
ncbi:MAG: acyl-CoA dehydrogenase C-terminal domain-containing protein [Pseudomonadales bacterium]|nr:acyl-CoA dehydrogenase C-terminal domain-containing protein [Pseudomonadales bacterium]